MLTLNSMVNETGSRNRILDMFKFRIRFRLVHCGTITPVIRWDFHQILHATRMWSARRVRIVFVRKWNWISDFRDVQIHVLAVFRLWSTCFSNIGAKFRVK